MAYTPFDMRASLPPPTPPDFTYCTERLGVDINPEDCFVAAGSIIDIDLEMGYWTSEPRLGIEEAELPYYKSHGNCYLGIETAGPSVPDPWTLRSRDLKIITAQTIQKCAIISGGMGGYSTYRFGSMMNFLLNETNDEINEPNKWPSSTAFITVTISSLNHEFETGDKDPSIPYVIASRIDQKYETPSTSGVLHQLFPEIFAFLENLAAAGFAMAENDSPWWKFDSIKSTTKTSPLSDEMTYKCDAKLGAPSSADCSHIEWSELAPDSQSLSIGPSTVTFLRQNTCYLAISASVALVLTWQQVHVALDALLNICVANPLVGSRGGRAFYGSPAPSRQISGRTATRKKRNIVTGYDALPSHANITIFQQHEAWRGEVEEAKSCTWRTVLESGDVSRC